jgi:HSP20 family protein
MNDLAHLPTRRSGDVAQRDQSRSTGEPALVPAVDVFEDAHGLTLFADLPGVARDRLELRAHDGNLYLEAEAVIPFPAELRLQHSELRQPRYARAFALSPDFDSSRIEANLQDGVLKLTIPRRDEARPRRIPVNGT